VTWSVISTLLFIHSIVWFVFEIGSLLVEKILTLYIRTTFSGFYELIRRRYTTLILMLIFLRIWTNTKPHFEKRCGGGIREAFDMVAQDNMWRYSVDTHCMSSVLSDDIADHQSAIRNQEAKQYQCNSLRDTDLSCKLVINLEIRMQLRICIATIPLSSNIDDALNLYTM
jgi:hypothetical protein